MLPCMYQGKGRMDTHNLPQSDFTSLLYFGSTLASFFGIGHSTENLQ